MRSAGPVAVVAIVTALAGCEPGPPGNGVSAPGDGTAGVDDGRCERLSGGRLAALRDNAESLGSLGGWRLGAHGAVACSEPYLDERVECELPRGAVLIGSADTSAFVLRAREAVIVRVTQDGAECLP